MVAAIVILSISVVLFIFFHLIEGPVPPIRHPALRIGIPGCLIVAAVMVNWYSSGWKSGFITAIILCVWVLLVKIFTFKLGSNSAIKLSSEILLLHSDSRKSFEDKRSFLNKQRTNRLAWARMTMAILIEGHERDGWITETYKQNMMNAYRGIQEELDSRGIPRLSRF